MFHHLNNRVGVVGEFEVIPIATCRKWMRMQSDHDLHAEINTAMMIKLSASFSDRSRAPIFDIPY